MNRRARPVERSYDLMMKVARLDGRAESPGSSSGSRAAVERRMSVPERDYLRIKAARLDGTR
jgi:hypothetical protein